VIFRLAGSFVDEIAEPSSPLFKDLGYELGDSSFGNLGAYKFNFISTALIFRLNFNLANMPIRK